MEQSKGQHLGLNAPEIRWLDKLIYSIAAFNMCTSFLHNLDILDLAPERKQVCIDAVFKISQGRNITMEDIEVIAELPDAHSPSAKFHSVLREEALKLKNNPVLSLLEHPEVNGALQNFKSVFRTAEYCNNLKVW